MVLMAIFLIGISVGFIAQRYAFCIFGSLVEVLTLGSPRRLIAVVVAMLVFGLVHITGYRRAEEFPGLIFLIGGIIQGVGYYMSSGCPLGLLVRIAEGSKFHLVVFLGFTLGLALYGGLLHGVTKVVLDPISTEKVSTLLDLLR